MIGQNIALLGFLFIQPMLTGYIPCFKLFMPAAEEVNQATPPEKFWLPCRFPNETISMETSIFRLNTCIRTCFKRNLTNPGFSVEPVKAERPGSFLSPDRVNKIFWGIYRLNEFLQIIFANQLI